MKLFQYYRNAALYPAMFVLFFSIVYSLLYNFSRGDLSNLSPMLMGIIPALIYSVLMSVLSLTILLNNIERISRNKILNILTWFLLPVVYVTIVVTIQRFKYYTARQLRKSGSFPSNNSSKA